MHGCMHAVLSVHNKVTPWLAASRCALQALPDRRVQVSNGGLRCCGLCITSAHTTCSAVVRERTAWRLPFRVSDLSSPHPRAWSWFNRRNRSHGSYWQRL